jgi:hypothetical protein
MTTPPEQPQAPPTPIPAAPSPSPGAVHELLHRLSAIEKENQKLRRQSMMTLVVTAVLLGLAGALTWTAARHGLPGFVPDVVEAREFVLRDHDGRVRGAWGHDDQGAIRLVLQDARTQTSIKLNLLDDGSSGLTFADSIGTPRLVMAVLPDETVNLVFGDRRGITRTVLGLGANGGSTLVFADQGGRTRAAIGVDNRGRTVLSTGPAETVEEEPADTAPEMKKPATRRRQ